MKYVKYLLGVFVLLGTVLIGVANVKAAEVPAGVNSMEQVVNSWQKETTLSNQMLVKSNRIPINLTLYPYFLFDLKTFYNHNPGGSFGNSIGIYFFSGYDSTTSTNSIRFSDKDFFNFVDLSSYSGGWLEFRVVRTIQGTDTENKILQDMNSNSRYDLGFIAISSQGMIPQNELWNYLTGYVDTIIGGRVDNAYQKGYDNSKNEFGYNDNGLIIPGQNAYDKGYSKGIQESGELKAEIINFIPGVLGSIFMFFFQLGQIGILGITILDILGILVLIAGLIFVIKFFF